MVVTAFDYDKLENQTTVKAGMRTLSANVYTGTGDTLLERVECGNGGEVKYTYDGFKRVQRGELRRGDGPALYVRVRGFLHSIMKRTCARREKRLCWGALYGIMKHSETKQGVYGL